MNLKILTGQTHPQIKLKHSWKVWICTSKQFVYLFNYLEVLILKLNFQKNEILYGPFYTFIGPFYTSHFIVTFVLKFTFDRAVPYENVALSLVVLWTKKQYSSFFRKVLVFQKTS